MDRSSHLFSDFSLPAFVAGALSSFVGFTASFAIVIQGLSAAGATPEQTTSGLMAVSVAMGLGGIVLSLKSRLPISVAWSTPGAALLATTGAPSGGFEAAVGAFVVTSILIVVAGLWKPLGRWVSAIPSGIANAMLAGVLIYFCLQPAQAVAEEPWLALPVVAAWVIMLRVNKLYAVPVALAVMILAILISGRGGVLSGQAGLWLMPVFIVPSFDLSSIVGIAVPLFLVTMASQNIPGIAVLNANGYTPPTGPLFTSTGVLSLFSAPFGGHGVNLAAITAAMCAGEDAHPDPSKRYWAAVVGGFCYIIYGLLAGLVTALIAGSPTVLINMVAGLALIGTFAAALTGAVSEARDREAAMVTFIVTASGLSYFGIGSAFWGLIAGLAIVGVTRSLRPTEDCR